VPATNGSTIDVYNVATKHTKVVRKIVGGINYTSIALSGSYIAYATRHGAIYRENIGTGKRVRLAAPLPNDPGGVEFDVYEYGDWVGWHALPVADELAKPLNRIRNAKTMAPAVSLAHTLYSLTSAGALLDSTATYHGGFSEAGVVTAPTRFWLRSYSSHTRALLAKRAYIAGPQIAGGILAWAGANGVLRVEPVPRP
jgi:hypothetical protein